MVRVGVTGGTGFIGGGLVPALAAAGHTPLVVDDRTGPVWVAHPEWPALVAPYESEGGLRRLADADVILHLGAVSGVMACAKDPPATYRVNVEGTRRLVAMCRERRIPIAFASSLAVVGSPERLPVTEATPARPTHEYARQKAEAEQAVRGPGAEAVMPTAVLRMSNVYGSYTVGPRTVSKGNVLTLFLEQAREGRLRVNAPGTQRRDFVHFEDVVAHWTAVVGWLASHANHPETRTFNVASGENFSVIELAEEVRLLWSERHVTTAPLKVEVVPNPRGGVELIDPEFRVSREQTEMDLNVRCEHRVKGFLRDAFARDSNT